MTEPTKADINPRHAHHNVHDLCRHARSVASQLNELSTQIAGLLGYAHRFQQATLHIGLVEPAVGIHRIALELANLQSVLLEALDYGAQLSYETREFAHAHKAATAPPQVNALPPGYPARISIGPMHTVTLSNGNIMGVFADPDAAEQFATECRTDGHEVTVEPPSKALQPQPNSTHDATPGPDETEDQ